MSSSGTFKKAIMLGLLLVVCLSGGWLYLRGPWQRFRERRAVQQAKRFALHQDFRNATLSARQALMLNPTNLEACELMASLAEAARAPQWLEWRQKIAGIAPTPGNKLKIAEASLSLQQPPWTAAAKALDELSHTAGQLAGFHALSAQLALGLNNLPKAELHLAEACRLEPTNQNHQLNLAVLRLRSTNLLVVSQSRAALEQLAQRSELKPLALRSLISEALLQTNISRAEAFSAQLAADVRANPSDRLQYLGILRLSFSPGFDLALRSLQEEYRTNAPVIHLVSSWMIHMGMAVEALTWLTNCPVEVKQQQPVRLALADCFMALHNWAGLEKLVEQEKWADLECVRLALLSQCASERHDEVGARGHWRLAVHQAAGKLARLQTLLGLATRWDRGKEREDLLWDIAQQFPQEHWAFQELNRLYSSLGNTRGLNKLYSVLSAADSADLVARNNFAVTSLLLRINLPRAHELARQNYNLKPSEPVIVSTYAFSLHLQGRTKEGLAALEKLTDSELQDPAIGLYYALLLQDDGQTQKAARFLAEKAADNLLPEERALLAHVRNGGA